MTYAYKVALALIIPAVRAISRTCMQINNLDSTYRHPEHVNDQVQMQESDSKQGFDAEAAANQSDRSCYRYVPPKFDQLVAATREQ